MQQVILDALVAKLLKSRFVPDAFAEAAAEVISLPENLSACLTDPAAIVAALEEWATSDALDAALTAWMEPGC